MKIILDILTEAIFNEDGISRILSHVNDDDTFAIIGSQDKDTKENRFDELLSLIRSVASKEKKIGWKYLEGTYTYEDGTTGLENSIIVYNISKEDALRIAKLLNQESIIWKDKDFFGFLTSDGIEDGELGRGMSFDKDKASMYGSKLLGKHNKAKAFVFEVLESSIKGNMFSKYKIDKIRRIPVMEVKRMEKKTISIQEELSKLDRSDSDKFYDLRRLYESVNLSVDKKKELAKMLVNESVDSKDVYDFLQGKEIKRDKLVESLNDSRNTLVEENDNASFTVPEDIEIGSSYETISGYITRESENKYKVFDEDGMYVDWADNFEDAYDLSMSIYGAGQEDPYWEEQREKDREEYANRDSWDEDDESDYTFLRRKTVTDSDGFTTDYAWYVSPNGTNVFVFGDMDYYRPEDGNFDFETESSKEAKEWFDNYKGPGEEEDDVDLDFDEYLTEAPDIFGIETDAEIEAEAEKKKRDAYEKRKKVIDGDMLTLAHNHEMLDGMAFKKTIAEKKKFLIDYARDYLKRIRKGPNSSGKVDFAYSAEYKDMPVDEDKLEKFADYVLDVYKNEDGVRFYRVGSSNSYYHVDANGVNVNKTRWKNGEIIQKYVDEIAKEKYPNVKYPMSQLSEKDKDALWDEAEELAKKDKDYVKIVPLSEAKKESSYGGAFDIADDQFFTREELDEFGYEIADKLTARFNKPFEYNGAFIEDGNRLEVDVMNDEFGEFTGKATIDMRKIKKPSDLNKYQIYIMDDITNQVSDVMKDFYGESFTEDVERDADWDKGLRYDEKEGCLTASKDVFDDWEDSQSLKESAEDEAWDYETSEKELKVFTNNWTIDKGSFNVTFEKEKEDMSDILKKHGYQVEVSGDDRGTPIEYHFEFYKAVDESVNFNKPHSNGDEAELEESLRDVMVAVGNTAKKFGKQIYDNTMIGTIIDDVKKASKNFNNEIDKAKKERYKQNINNVEIGETLSGGKPILYGPSTQNNFKKFMRSHGYGVANYQGKNTLEKESALIADIFEGKIKSLSLIYADAKTGEFVYITNKKEGVKTAHQLSKEFLLSELNKLDTIDNAADQLEGDSENSNESTDDIELAVNK